jgi:hypothetical protein
VLLNGGDRHNFVCESRIWSHHFVFPSKDAGLMYFHVITNAEIGGFLGVYFRGHTFLRVVWSPHDFKIIWGDYRMFLNLFEK